jgi:hypothetical protein
MAEEIPLTGCGTEDCVSKVPKFVVDQLTTPQQLTVRSSSIAHDWTEPAETRIAFVIPETCTGDICEELEPLPS